jgi:hypothetical protein
VTVEHFLSLERKVKYAIILGLEVSTEDLFLAVQKPVSDFL